MSINQSTGIVPVTASSPELLSQARELLERAQSLEEVLHIRNGAKAAEQYFKAAEHSREMAKEAAEIRLRSERKAGQMLARMKETGEREGQGGDRKSNSQDGSLISLADLHISYNQSSRYQDIAAEPDELFEGYIEQAHKHEFHEMTTSGLRTYCKFYRKAEQAEAIRRQPQPLPTGPFHVIVVDPPWPYAMRRPTINDSRGYPEYSGMSLEEINALPVSDLAADDALLWLWTTNAFLPDAFQVIQSWGFQYRAALVWGKNHIGLGDWLRVQTEHCLMASRGRPLVTLGNQSTLLLAPAREHSRKPEEFYTLVESLCPTPPLGRIELFARGERPGWRVWGHESRSSIYS
jgi:N6-adenosine-specific RNA methylase IME4